MSEIGDGWRKCSACKKAIPFGSVYWVCSVTTCNRQRSSFVFCSVPCWDAHLPIMSHRRAWAEERKAPRAGEATVDRSNPRQHETERSARKEKAMDSNPGTAATTKEVLVVASKVKGYIKDKSGMNTSASVFDALSDRIRALCDAAVESARNDGRKTVMDRDFA
jgi:hypothetical protein